MWGVPCGSVGLGSGVVTDMVQVAAAAHVPFLALELLHAMCMVKKRGKKGGQMWPPTAPWAGHRQWEVPDLLPVPGIYTLPTFPTVGAVPKDLVLR